MSTTLRSIDEYYDLAERLERFPTVVSADVLERDARVNQPAIEVLVGPRLERVPPAVVRVLGEGDLGVRSVNPRPNGHFVVLAV